MHGLTSISPRKRLSALVGSCLLVAAGSTAVAGVVQLNPHSMKVYTVESAHFRVHYHEGLHRVAEETAEILEELYDVYRNTYNLVLPRKTDVLVIDNDIGDGWAQPLANTILVSANDMDFNLRGTHDWLRDVVTHEYAHILSISTGFKFPPWMPGVQLGSFTHPNEGFRTEAFHLLPSEILPFWFYEGIAQFESSRRGTDRWDSHRDMILRTMVLSDRMLSYDHMCALTGRGDEYEKVYNQGFSLISYIAREYGYEKVVAITRETARPLRLNFDQSIKSTLGMSARELYDEWKRSLKTHYTKQVQELGTQVYGKKINKKGFDNYWPRFGPAEEKIYFTSNGDHDYSWRYRSLHSYALSDTVKEDEKIKLETPVVKEYYDIHDSSGLIAFTSMKSPKSRFPPDKGGGTARDLFIDTLPSEDKGFRLLPDFDKTERQLTEKQSVFHGAFSPDGDMLAVSIHRKDRHFLGVIDTADSVPRVVYPDTADRGTAIHTIYSVDWAPDGRRIAVSYIDKDNRKTGIYDTSSGEFLVLCDTEHDERDPRFSPAGERIYFSSDRTGIFNVYSYEFESKLLRRHTNVSGGAFAPDVSSDEKQLVYTNYDADGYGIYLIDSVRVLEEIPMGDSLLTERAPLEPEKITTKLTPPRLYSKLPRKLFFAPTLYYEEIVTDDDDPYRGQGRLKLGAALNLLDPFTIGSYGFGNELGAFLFLDASKLFGFIDPDRGFLSPTVDYDLGLYGQTWMLDRKSVV